MDNDQRIAEIEKRINEGRPILRTDVKHLLALLAAKDAEIERLREAQRWIPVTERLPEVWQGEYGEPLEFNVMLAEGTEATTMCFDGSQWFEMIWSEMKRGENFAVTHWQPIPAAPEKGAEK